MSWFTPKHFEDAQRILRGLALVAAKTAADSEVLKHATRGDVRRAAKAAADMARYQAQPVADAVGQATRDTAQSASNISDVLQGGAQNAEALFHQTQSGAQQVGSQAYQQADNALSQDTAVSSPDNVLAAPLQAVQQPSQGVKGRMLTFVSAGGKATLSSTAQTGSEPTSGRSKRSQSASFAGIPEPVYAESSYASPSTAAASPNSLQENPTSVAEDEVDTVIARTNPADRPPTEPSSATRGESNAASTPEASPSAVTADPTPPPSSAPIPSAAAPAYPTDSGSTLSEASQSVAAPLPPPATAPQSAHAEYRRLMQQRHRDRLNLHKDQINEQKEEVRKKLRERRVPSSAFGRAAGFAGMGASLVFGSMRDSVSNYFAPTEKAKQEGYNAYLTDKNAERLATALCRMRGAALKLGQMLSIQDEGVLPPQFQQALERVRAGADVMPQGQLHKVIQAELGVNWRNRMATFEDEPLAAASIGQVHGGKLHDGRRFAMKIQYPGVARSIESDVDNLMRLINIANLLPKGLYVEQAAEVAKRELSMECDYEYEARCQKRFKKLISSDPDLAESFNVPDIIDELSGKTVITSEWVPGVHIDKVKTMSQDIRNDVGSLLLRLTMRELFDWRFMQTDPNWGNFLYDEHADQLHLIDFGAAKEYPKPFVDDYLRMVLACADKNRDEVILRSTKLKFLTGDESKVMLDAHCDAGYLVGQPFATEGLYDFAMHSALSRKIAALGGVMLKHRLTAPPEEAYSLHRKLSGAFLACIKLGSQVPCRDILVDCAQGYKFD
ncbi:MAG: chaperone activity of bc1 complex- mitochondrial-like [Trebouxia sp. A1-2]|nr:MAG: chaperone activity of bc1 complex- mitochondrial-like [Trebouxia sp. A1-2]KAA6420576.1 MAG: chaperone activity of bc1 complex- mitochondrial-like [Trebouxia sp. A1-2]